MDPCWSSQVLVPFSFWLLGFAARQVTSARTVIVTATARTVRSVKTAGQERRPRAACGKGAFDWFVCLQCFVSRWSRSGHHQTTLFATNAWLLLRRLCVPAIVNHYVYDL